MTAIERTPSGTRRNRVSQAGSGGLLVVSFGLVVVATVLLVLGLVSEAGLGLISASIATSLLAGVSLVVSSRASRGSRASSEPVDDDRRRDAPADSTSTYLADHDPTPEGPSLAGSKPSASAGESVDVSIVGVPPWAKANRTPTSKRKPSAGRATGDEPALRSHRPEPAPNASEPTVDDLAPLPIEGYDSMTVSQIVAELADLDAADLRRLAAHETTSHGRRTVLTAIDRQVRRAAGSTNGR